MIYAVLFAVLGYVGIMAYMFIFQRKLIYDPDIKLGTPEVYGLGGLHVETLTAEDGVRVTAWVCDAQPGHPTIVYYHGNRGHIGDRAAKLQQFIAMGFGLIAVSYRGYGTSEGRPTEQGIYADARAAVRYAIEQKKIPQERLLIYGESLGSGVAVQMATEFQAGGLVLEAPYLSMVKKGLEKYPYVPVPLLLKDRFDSIAKINRVNMPVLILHGHKDDTIPIRHGRTLLAAANAPKEGVFYPTIGHTDFDFPTIVSRVKAFAQRRGLVDGPRE